MTIYIGNRQPYCPIYTNQFNHPYLAVSIDNQTVKKLAKTGLLDCDGTDSFEFGSCFIIITKKITGISKRYRYSNRINQKKPFSDFFATASHTKLDCAIFNLHRIRFFPFPVPSSWIPSPVINNANVNINYNIPFNLQSPHFSDSDSDSDSDSVSDSPIINIYNSDRSSDSDISRGLNIFRPSFCHPDLPHTRDININISSDTSSDSASIHLIPSAYTGQDPN